MAEPARQLVKVLLQRAGHKGEGRRAGSAIEVLVTATDRQVGPRAIEVDRQRACRMGQVPEHQGAGAVRQRSDCGHVQAGTAAVVDLGQHHHRGVFVDRVGDALAFDQQFVAGALQRCQTLGDVQVGGKVAGFADDHPPLRAQGQRAGQQRTD